MRRRYKDGESKRLSDPLALINSYLLRRTEIKSSLSQPSSSSFSSITSTSFSHHHERGNEGRSRGNYGNGRTVYPLPSSSSRNEEITAPILAPRRRRGEIPLALRPSFSNSSSNPLPAALSPPPPSPPPPPHPPTNRGLLMEAEARQTTEAARAKHLLARAKEARRLASRSSYDHTPSSISTRTPAAEGGGRGGRRDGAGEDQYNSQATREARLGRTFPSFPSPSDARPLRHELDRVRTGGGAGGAGGGGGGKERERETSDWVRKRRERDSRDSRRR